MLDITHRKRNFHTLDDIFSRLNKSVRTENKEHTYFTIAKHFIIKLSLLLIILSDTKLNWHMWRQNTAVLRILLCHVLYSICFYHCTTS